MTGFGVGPPSFVGMCAVLDEMGVEDRDRRAELRSYWRAMASAEMEIREAKAESERKRQEERKNQKHRRRAE